MSLLIDQITMPPKSQEVSQIQHAEQTKNQNADQELASQFQAQVKQNSEQTIRRAKTENEELRYKDRENKRRKKQASSRKEGKKKAGSQEKEEPGTPELPHFDMKI